MKRPVTLTVNDFEFRKAKEAGFNVSELLNHALELANRKQVEEVRDQKTKHVVKKLECSWCHKPIVEEIFSICAFHKNIFCENCALNGGKKVFDIMCDGRPAKCMNNYTRIDCILEKVKSVDVEVNNAQ